MGNALRYQKEAGAAIDRDVPVGNFRLSVDKNER